MQSLLIFPLVALGINFAQAAEPATSGAPSVANPMVASALNPLVRPSLRNLGGRLVNPAGIAEAFKQSSAAAATKSEELWKPNEALINEWTKYNRESTPFLRGEMEDESVMKNLLTTIQLVALRVRADALAAKWPAVKTDLDSWFLFASDVTYEEATLISLRLANLIRSMLLDELERMDAAMATSMSAPDLEAWLVWVNGIRLSWPIDRVIMTESKKILGNKMMFTAQQVASALQKNAYQTAAVALKSAQGPKNTDIKLLEKMWRTEDIEAMKTEVHRLTALKIRIAKDLYVKKIGQMPKGIQDLVSQHLLSEIPLDYSTGKPFTLSEAALH